jgi:UDP-N-acetyl-D-glucosamine dehydrogenase
VFAGRVRVDSTVILESTTYPGTTEEELAPILEAGSGLRSGADFHLGYSPERIDPGNAVWNFRRTPKVVSGVDVEPPKAVQSSFDCTVDVTITVKSMRETDEQDAEGEVRACRR